MHKQLFGDDFKLDNVNVNSVVLLPNGLYPQPAVDLNVVCCMGQLLDQADSKTGNDCVMARRQRVAIVACIRNSMKISSRLKCGMKTQQGAGGNLGKKAWDFMVALEAEYTDQGSCDQSKVEELAVVMAEFVSDWSETDLLDMVDFLSETCSKHGEDFVKLGKAFSGCSADDLDNQELHNVIESLPSSVFSLVSLVLDKSDKIMDFCKHMFERSFGVSEIMASWITFAKEDSTIDIHEDMLGLWPG